MSFQLGPLRGSKTRSPPHSSWFIHGRTPRRSFDWLHVGCTQELQDIVMPFMSSNGGLLKQYGQRGYVIPLAPPVLNTTSSNWSTGHTAPRYSLIVPPCGKL